VPKQKKQDFGTSRWRLSNKSYTNFSCAEGGLAEGADRQVRLNLVEMDPIRTFLTRDTWIKSA